MWRSKRSCSSQSVFVATCTILCVETGILLWTLDYIRHDRFDLVHLLPKSAHFRAFIDNSVDKLLSSADNICALLKGFHAYNRVKGIC